MTWLIWMCFLVIYFSVLSKSETSSKNAYAFSPPNLLFFFSLQIVLQFKWIVGLKMNWISKFLVVLFFWQVCCIQLDNHELQWKWKLLYVQRYTWSVSHLWLRMLNISYSFDIIPSFWYVNIFLVLNIFQGEDSLLSRGGCYIRVNQHSRSD